MEKVALAIIVKDEIKEVDRIIRDYAHYFTEVYLGIDDAVTYQRCLDNYSQVENIKVYKYPDEYIEDGRVKDFAHKRNWLEEKIKCPYYFRLDTDDEIIGIENLKDILAKVFKENISIVYCNYLYSRDDWGNVNAQHYRETIIKVDDNLYWNKPIHENILPKTTKDHRIVLDKSLVINHLAKPEKLSISFERNVKYLLDEYNKDKENTDPRTLAYLGRMLFSAGSHKEALFFLQKHIEKSGWDEDRYESWCQIAEIMKQKGELDQAQGAIFEALVEKPSYPSAYFKLHDIYQEQGEWDKAIFWAEEGLKKPVPKTFTLVDPSSYTWRPMLSLSFCYFQKGDFEKAKKLFDIVKKKVPTLPWVQNHEKLYQQAYEHQQYMNHLLWIVEFLREKEETKIKPLIESIPNELQEHEMVAKLKNSFLEPKVWEENEIAIFCGMSGEKWSPKSVETGIGGSEEAVISMSKELTKLGYKVTVYNTCYEDEGEYDGVRYINTHKFNSNDKHNILVAWRMNIFPYIKSVKQKIIWLHDLPITFDWGKEVVDGIDKIIVLSEYHKSLLPKEIPDEKIFVSSNGIVPEQFEELDKIERKLHRIIYASSYNRGLEKILRDWQKIRKEVSDAELHIFYGWEVYDRFVKEGYIKDTGWKQMMIELMKQDGVYEHGRVGHYELLEEYAKSGVYAYPSTYTGEINCIALTKAVACGCNVVTNDFAVLKERSPNAVKDEEFTEEVIRQLKEGKRLEINREYIKENSWETIAKDWKGRLFK